MRVRGRRISTQGREKVTYVWNLCTKHPSDYSKLGFDDIGKRGVLIVLKKESYELWHKILVNIESCQTWGDIRGLGADVYAEVLNRGKCIYLETHQILRRRAKVGARFLPEGLG